MIKDIHILHAFTESGTGGNPAGVIVDADDLTRAQRQKIAQRLGLSEIAFVNFVNKRARLEFFTPLKQIAQCGHATIATAGLLHILDRLPKGPSTIATINGPLQIDIRDPHIYLKQRAPIFNTIASNSVDADHIKRSLNLKNKLSLNDLYIVDTGNRFLVMPVETEKELSNLVPNMDAIKSISQRFNLVGYYVFTRDTSFGYDAAARMFAPAYGISEESATGMGAGTLAAYLHDHEKIMKPDLYIRQGHLMTPPSPSAIHVHIDDVGDRITGLWAGGSVQHTQTVTMEI